MGTYLTEDLLAAVKSGNNALRRDATATLAQVAALDSDEAAEARTLLEQLARFDPDDQVRMFAGTALGWDRVLLAAIATVFHSRSVPARLDATATLGHFVTHGSPDEVTLAHEWLIRAAGHDRDAKVRDYANEMLPAEDRIRRVERIRGVAEPKIRHETGARRADRAPAKLRWRYLWILLLLILSGISVSIVNQLRPEKSGSRGTSRVVRQSPTVLPEQLDLCTQPAWEPGVHVAAFFTHQREIMLLDADRGVYTNLTNSVTMESYPEWSPDGSMLAFLSVSHGDPKQSIEVLDIGSGMQTPRVISGDVDAYGQLAWSADGKRIFFEGRAADIDYAQDFELFAAQVDGTGVTRLTSMADGGFNLALSPDRQRIAYAHQGLPADTSSLGYSDIHIITASGEPIGDVTVHQVSMNLHLEWSADGAYLYFVADGVGTDPVYHIPSPDIYRVRADATGRTAITTSPIWEDWFMVSPTGRDILYSVAERNLVEGWLSPKLVLKTADGDQKTQFGLGDKPENAAWSPDGNFLLYSLLYKAGVGRNGVHQLLLYDMAKQQSQFIGTGMALHFIWDPDGTHFLYRIGDIDDNCRLFLGSISDLSNPVELPCLSAIDGPYHWRP
jgi:Tol biopolymer transport system component